MAITFRGAPQSAAVDGGAPQVSLTGVQAGDLLVAIGATDFYTVSALVAPTGAPGSPTWTLRATGDDGINGAHIRVWTAVAAQTGTHTLTLPASDDAGRYIAAAALAGADPEQIAAAGDNGGNSANHVAPSVNAPTDGALLITGHTCRQSTSTEIDYTAPSGMTTFATERDVSGPGYMSALGTFSQTVDSGATGTRTAVASASRISWATIAIAIGAAAGGVDEVTPADAAHGHGADQPAVGQVHSLSPDDAAHAHAAGQPALAQVHALTGADAAHAQTADQPALTQTHAVTADGAGHAHTADRTTLVQAHTLTAADAAHGHTVGAAGLAQAHTLVPADNGHGHTAGTAALTQAHTLVPADTGHGHTAGTAALTQAHQLVAVSAAHGHMAGTALVTVGAVILTPAAASHSHNAGQAALAQDHALTPADAAHAHTAGQPTVTPPQPETVIRRPDIGTITRPDIGLIPRPTRTWP